MMVFGFEQFPGADGAMVLFPTAFHESQGGGVGHQCEFNEILPVCLLNATSRGFHTIFCQCQLYFWQRFTPLRM